MFHKVDYRRHPVLYVDDERNNLTVFRLAFSDEFTVRTAMSGEEALEILATEPISVLLADQRMPRMTGTVLVEKVKQRYPDVVRMIVTAYTDSRAAVDAINRGEVYRFISKPWREEELRSILRTAIDVSALGAMVGDLQYRMMRSERLASVGFATAGLTHDMKTPLSSLALGLDLLGRHANKLEGVEGAAHVMGEMRKVISDCKAASRQLRSLVESVRTHVKETAPVSQRVRLGEVAESALRLCRGEILSRAQVGFDRGECPEVLGDPAQLGQVMINLLINAAQAIEPGSTGENRVRLVVAARDGAAIFQVADTGRGIPGDLRTRIFEPFFSTRSDEGGTGLGLAIVREIVERHSGTIVVESSPGAGTTFTVTLPPAP